MIFPYWEVLRDAGPILEPLLIISVYGRERSAEIVALVDSGAERNVFPLSVAERLDISLHSARHVAIVGVGNQQTLDYEVPVELELGRHRWTAPVIFSPAVTGEALLGQDGFFSFFNVDFLRRKRQMNIRWVRRCLNCPRVSQSVAPVDTRRNILHPVQSRHIMPAWVSVYCTSAVDDIAPHQLLAGIQNIDYLTLAEQYGIEDSRVAHAIALLNLQRDVNGFQLTYRPAGERQLEIHCWTSPDHVSVEVEEALESLDDDSSDAADSIRENLKNIQAVIGIELGFRQLEDMGVVFAYEVARWFGQHRGGLIKADDDHWFLVDGEGFVHL